MNMIEKVVRAIMSIEHRDWDSNTICGDCEQSAIAAIEAMKEPTDKMTDCIVWYPNGAKAYKAMIEAALKE